VDLVVEPVGDADDRRGLRLLHGDRPSPDQAAGYWLAEDLGPVLRRLDGLEDDERRATLTRSCRRLLADEGG
jgi:hypothetical protein